MSYSLANLEPVWSVLLHVLSLLWFLDLYIHFASKFGIIPSHSVICTSFNLVYSLESNIILFLKFVATALILKIMYFMQH